jgi:hypothetical protein
MSYPPPGDAPDPYQPQQPPGPPSDPTAPFGSPDPYAASPPPSSGQPYGGQPYGAPTSGQGYGPGYQQPYGAPGYPPGYPPPAVGTNVMAILSLVFAFIFAPAAIVFGHVAKKQIRRTGEQGETLATVGLWLGYIFTGLTVALCALWGIILAATATNQASGF